MGKEERQRVAQTLFSTFKGSALQAGPRGAGSEEVSQRCDPRFYKVFNLLLKLSPRSASPLYVICCYLKATLFQVPTSPEASGAEGAATKEEGEHGKRASDGEY